MKKFLVCLSAILLIASMSNTARASSSGVDWTVIIQSGGASLTADYVRSFLGGSSSKTQIFRAICNPTDPRPYVTAVFRARSGVVPQQQVRMSIKLLETNSYLLPIGTLDRVATVNARDNRARYGFSLPIDSIFFDLLGDEQKKYQPRINVDGVGGGHKLEIYRVEDRKKVQAFHAACKRFAGGTVTATPKPPEIPQQSTGSQIFTAEYECGQNVRFHAQFDHRPELGVAIIVPSDGPQLRLTQVPSGSGVEYSNGSLSLHTKAKMAVLLYQGNTLNCTQIRCITGNCPG